MQHVENTPTAKTRAELRPANLKRRRFLLMSVLLACLLLMVFNFANFHLTQRQTVIDTTFETGSSGETMPANMAPGFSLNYTVTGENDLATAIASSLPAALADTQAGVATAVANVNAVETPRLHVAIDSAGRLWTPIYGRARVTAIIHFASHAAVPWPQDAPMMLSESPEIQATGTFTLTDTSWGLLSKPAYDDMLAEALAEAITVKLEKGVWTRP